MLPKWSLVERRDSRPVPLTRCQRGDDFGDAQQGCELFTEGRCITLVLQRKPEEEVIITGPCVLRVVEICGGKARLGFIAPATTKVVRAELESPTFMAQRIPSISDRIHGNVDDLGRRRSEFLEADEVADAFDREVEAEMIDHGV
jgi:sRNA-binding carbon storage regulator CsrA